MEFKTLNNGVKMPCIGIGTFPYKGNELKTVLNYCWSEGYRLFDTAWLYQNEKEIGEFLRDKKQSDVFLTSKLHINQLYSCYNHRFHIGLRKSFVKTSYVSSCKRLGVNQLDLYLLHAPFHNYKKLYASITKLYRLGKVKAIGVSNFTIENLKELLQTAEIIPAVNQIEFNPFNCNRAIVDYCEEKGIVIEAFSPFGRGLLTKEIMENSVLISIGKNYNKTVAQVVLRWLTQQGIVAIPRSNKIDKIKQNISVFDFELTKSEIDSIYYLNKNIHTVGGKIRIGND